MRLWRPCQLELQLDEVVRSASKLAMQCDAVPLRPGEVLPAVGTRFGGIPYAEAGDAWPMFRDRPYDFVAQLNLRECEEPPTDAYDLITVFICWHVLGATEKFDDGEVRQACLVRSYRNPTNAKAIPMLRPEPIGADDFQVTECAVQSRNVPTYPRPGWELEVPAIAAVARNHAGYQESFEKSSYRQGHQWRENFHEAYAKSLKRLGFKSQDECTQMGGYPTWVHDNTLLDNETFFVAQIAHEPAANFCVGDAAPLFIAAHRSDPTRFETDPWQSH